MINLTVKTLQSQNLKFGVKNDTTVYGLKLLITEAIGISMNQQRLIFMGNELDDVKRLSDYGVDGKVLHLVAQPLPRQTGRRNVGLFGDGIYSDGTPTGCFLEILLRQITEARSVLEDLEAKERAEREHDMNEMDPVGGSAPSQISEEGTDSESPAGTSIDTSLPGPSGARKPSQKSDPSGYPRDRSRDRSVLLANLSNMITSLDEDAGIVVTDAMERSMEPLMCAARPQQYADMLVELTRLETHAVRFRAKYARWIRDSLRENGPLSAEEAKNRQEWCDLITQLHHALAHAHHVVADLDLRVTPSASYLVLGVAPRTLDEQYTRQQSQNPRQQPQNLPWQAPQNMHQRSLIAQQRLQNPSQRPQATQQQPQSAQQHPQNPPQQPQNLPWQAPLNMHQRSRPQTTQQQPQNAQQQPHNAQQQPQNPQQQPQNPQQQPPNMPQQPQISSQRPPQNPLQQQTHTHPIVLPQAVIQMVAGGQPVTLNDLNSSPGLNQEVGNVIQCLRVITNLDGDLEQNSSGAGQSQQNMSGPVTIDLRNILNQVRDNVREELREMERNEEGSRRNGGQYLTENGFSISNVVITAAPISLAAAAQAAASDRAAQAGTARATARAATMAASSRPSTSFRPAAQPDLHRSTFVCRPGQNMPSVCGCPEMSSTCDTHRDRRRALNLRREMEERESDRRHQQWLGEDRQMRMTDATGLFRTISETHEEIPSAGTISIATTLLMFDATTPSMEAQMQSEGSPNAIKIPYFNSFQLFELRRMLLCALRYQARDIEHRGERVTATTLARHLANIFYRMLQSDGWEQQMRPRVDLYQSLCAILKTHLPTLCRSLRGRAGPINDHVMRLLFARLFYDLFGFFVHVTIGGVQTFKHNLFKTQLNILNPEYKASWDAVRRLMFWILRTTKDGCRRLNPHQFVRRTDNNLDYCVCYYQIKQHPDIEDEEEEIINLGEPNLQIHNEMATPPRSEPGGFENMDVAEECIELPRQTGSGEEAGGVHVKASVSDAGVSAAKADAARPRKCIKPHTPTSPLTPPATGLSDSTRGSGRDESVEVEDGQPPFSDAYLSGMSARRRQRELAQRPPTNVGAFVQECVVDSQGVSREAAVRGGAGAVRALVPAARPHMVQTLAARARASRDYQPGRSPAITSLLERRLHPGEDSKRD